MPRAGVIPREQVEQLKAQDAQRAQKGPKIMLPHAGQLVSRRTHDLVCGQQNFSVWLKETEDRSGLLLESPGVKVWVVCKYCINTGILCNPTVDGLLKQ